MSLFDLKSAILISTIATGSFVLNAAATEPNITSAQLSGSSLIISGSNFGIKANAAPFFYQDYTTNNGVPDADLLVGYANQRQYGSNAYGSSTTIDTSMGRTAGRGALKLDIAAGAADYFPHVSVNASNTGRGSLGSQNADELYISYWVKLALISGSPAQNSIQLKSARSGTGSPSTNYYGDYPLYVSSLYLKADMSGYIGTYQETRDSSNTTSSGEHFDTTNTSMWLSSGWNFVEIWQKYNTPGIADGFFRYRINGVAIDKDIAAANISAIKVRQGGDAGKHFDFAMLVGGVDIPDHSATSRYRLLFSEHYIDTTPQHVMLGNAPTLSTITGRLLCPPTAWNNNSLTVNASNIPSGYNWVYVTNDAGQTNAIGFSIQRGVYPPTAPVLTVTAG